MAVDMTRQEIEERFEEAALTLRRLPDPPGSGPKNYGSSWPDYIQEARHAYGYHEARMRVVPTAGEIERMEEAIGWLRFVDADAARLLWMRAEQHRWRQVAIRLGITRQHAWRLWVAALETVRNRINGRRGGAKVPPPKKKAVSSAKGQKKLSL